MNIGVDIDLTIVDTGNGWRSWLEKHFPQIKEIPEHNISYNLGEYFGKSKTGLTHFEYWDNNHLYDDLEFIHGVEESLRSIKECGHNLYFTSHTRPGHFKSKFRMLNRLGFVDFSKGDAFFATQEKGALSGCISVMVDDRNKFLNQFSGDVIKIRYDTPYSQDQDKRVVYDLCSGSWTSIADFILENVV